MADYGLTQLQLEILKVLWTRGEATATDVREELRPARELAQTTVSTLLGRLEKKGLVAHRTSGRQYVYRARVNASQVKRSVVDEVVETAELLFAGDVTELVGQLLAQGDVGAEDLARVRELIERKEAELRESEAES